MTPIFITLPGTVSFRRTVQYELAEVIDNDELHHLGSVVYEVDFLTVCDCDSGTLIGAICFIRNTEAPSAVFLPNPLVSSFCDGS